ncbi:uncharacterized protein EV420DRAFT_714089 [Desarmillaria tabescens]|uniref:Uncharacterized protein n=1 Tax=Armillaria tabescens TaxID=1929756 RepID=A0AA39MZ22_ARMTA|nr:uncharacterized protein EV420DRAFT_714089 [Desarmillaria tabescens]KAK0451369.1 hypothetical protein EV420DRAFT_714089 [Desarmillaria tabescens]
MQTLILVFLLAVNVSGASPDDSDSSSLPPCSKELRTKLSIIWSCLATIFASTWLAAHPNVPGRKLTKEGSLWRIFDRRAIMCSLERLKLMLIAILAPEATVGWAIRQFLVARKVRAYSSKDHELKLVHGFFVSMGGFYYGKEEKLVTLKDVPKFLEPLAKVRDFDIKDKSKGDALSKMVAVLQISWFVVQCCARGVRKLPITLLEMSALAFAMLSIASYAAWWEKPVDVLYHIRLEEHSSLDQDQDDRASPEVFDLLDVDTKPAVALSPSRSFDTLDKLSGVDSSNPIELRPPPSMASFEPTAGYSSGWLNISDASTLKNTTTHPGPSLLELIRCCFKTAERWRKRAIGPFTGIYFSMMGFIFGDDIGSGVERPVPTAAIGAVGMSCCDGDTSTEADHFLMRLLAVLYVGGLFGAIHCAAWSFDFPSHAEKVLWRTSSLAIIIGLVNGVGHILMRKGLFTIFGVISSLIQRARKGVRRSRVSSKISPLSDDYIVMEKNGVLKTFMDFGSIVLSVLGAGVYIVARITLIVLALLEFRSLPPLALRTVNWTTFIPHI